MYSQTNLPGLTIRPLMRLVLGFESFFLVPSLSTGPQDNRSAIITAFTVNYIAVNVIFLQRNILHTSRHDRTYTDLFIQCPSHCLPVCPLAVVAPLYLWCGFPLEIAINLFGVLNKTN